MLLGEAVFEEDDDPPDLHCYHTGGFSYRRQPLDILRSSSSSTSGPKDAEGILTTSTLSKESYSRPGRLLLRSTWPPGRPLDLLARVEIRTFRVVSKKPLRLNGFTATSLGRAGLPFRGTCSPPCISSISLMTNGAVASLPARGSPLPRQEGYCV